MFPNLRAEMARREITIKQLAQHLGISEKTAQNKVSGKSEFTLSEIQSVCRLFKLTADYLFSIEGASA